MRLLDRYLRRLLFSAFLHIVAILTGLMVIQRFYKIIELAIARGLSVVETSTLVLWSLPITLFYSVPISLLTGILLALGKLTADNEIVAARAAGISRSRLCRPALMLSLVLALLMTGNNLWLAPQSYVYLDNIGFGVGVDPIKALEPGRVSRFGQRLLAVGEIEREAHAFRRLFAVLPASDLGGNSGRMLLLASAGQWEKTGDQIFFRLGRGSMRELTAPGSPVRHCFNFSSFSFGLSLPRDRSPHPKRLSCGELLKKGERIHLVELSRRLGNAWIMPLFVLAALPLAIDARRTLRRGRARGVVLYSLLIYFFYWVSTISVESFVEAGTLPLAFLFLPYLLLGGGAALIWKVTR